MHGKSAAQKGVGPLEPREKSRAKDETHMSKMEKRITHEKKKKAAARPPDFAWECAVYSQRLRLLLRLL